MTFMFSIDSDRTIIERSVYNTFMLLGDIGGFTELLYFISAIVVSFMTYESSEKHLVKRLYKGKEDKVDKDSNKLHTIKV